MLPAHERVPRHQKCQMLALASPTVCSGMEMSSKRAPTSEDRVVSVAARETMRARRLRQDAADPDIAAGTAWPKLGVVRETALSRESLVAANQRDGVTLLELSGCCWVTSSSDCSSRDHGWIPDNSLTLKSQGGPLFTVELWRRAERWSEKIQKALLPPPGKRSNPSRKPFRTSISFPWPCSLVCV